MRKLLIDKINLMKDLLQKNKYYYITIFFFLLLGGVVLLSNSKADVTLWVNSLHSPFLDFLFLKFNIIGDVEFSIICIALILVLKDWRLALKAVCCFIAVMLVTQFMKYILFSGTLRPILYFPESTLRLVDGVVQLTTESFPSGHTSASFSIATFFALYKSGRSWNFIFAFFALMVGYGRIYLSQHFITDVYVGMIVGVLITTLVYFFYPKSLDVHAK